MTARHDLSHTGHAAQISKRGLGATSRLTPRVARRYDLPTMALNVDFVADATATIRTHLTGLGYWVPTPLSAESIRIQYFNLKHRLLRQVPRTTHRAANFSCPPEHRAGLGLVEAKIASGADLRPHLSRGILKLDYSDALLNDWGVYHLHLGTTVDADGFIARTGPVLFARFTQSDAYLIDVKRHGSWSNQDIVKAIHSNWPESIERFKLKGIASFTVPGDDPTTDDDVSKMRKAGGQVLQELGGAVYAPIGGGYSTNRTSANVVIANDTFVKWLRTKEGELVNFESSIRSQLKAGAGVDLPETVSVSLQLGANNELVATIGDQIATVPIGTWDL